MSVTGVRPDTNAETGRRYDCTQFDRSPGRLHQDLDRMELWTAAFGSFRIRFPITSPVNSIF